MKKMLLFVACLLISSTAFSQLEGDYNYTIGLRAYSLIQMPKILNQTNPQDYFSTYLNGVMVKFNDNQISYRINANFFKKDLSFFNQCASCEVATGKVTDYAFTVGFEKNLNYAKFQPYFGADVGFRANYYNGEIRSINSSNSNMVYDVEATKNGFLIRPLVGIKFTPVNRISFFAETSLDCYYSYERQETVQRDPQNTRSFVKYNKWEFLINPISVGLQVHLVSNN